jgi:hypothetical protein
MRYITVAFVALFQLWWLGAIAQVGKIRPGTLFGNAVTVRSGSETNIKEIHNLAFPPLQYWFDNYLYNLFFLKGFEKGWDRRTATLSIDQHISFVNCPNYDLPRGDLNVLPAEIPDSVRFRMKGSLNITDISTPVHIGLRNLVCERGVSIFRNQLISIDVEDCVGSLYLMGNMIDGVVSLSGSNGFLTCSKNKFISPVTTIELTDSHFRNQAAIEKNSYHEMLVRCIRDSFGAAISMANGPTPEQLPTVRRGVATRFDAVFKDCYFNGPIKVGKNGALACVRFEHCSFGPDASSVSLVADSVSFVDCSNLPSQLSLQLTANRDTCWLQLQHTNLGEASFIYGPGIHLAFDKGVQTDEYTGIYETLLSKLKNEGKKESYERLDIEYHHFKAAKSTFWGRIADKAQEQWWNYGYSRLRVVLWTFLFLGIFFVFNLLFWRGMQQVYPIPQEYIYVDRFERPVRYRFVALLRVLLYTVYVFFSLKIDLPRLKVTKPALVVYFFLQWQVGLWCLFFIVNALLKIG